LARRLVKDAFVLWERHHAIIALTWFLADKRYGDFPKLRVRQVRSLYKAFEAQIRKSQDASRIARAIQPGIDVTVARFRVSTNHRWLRRRVQIDSHIFSHRQRLVCRRDFVRGSDDAEWRAVHVGVLEFDLLDEETTRRLVSEDCPGRPLPREENCARIQPAGEVYGSYKRRAGG
jgi:hypothetical protein